MSFVAKIISAPVKWIGDAVESVVDFAVDKILEPVIDVVSGVVEGMMDDPITTIATIAALATGNAWAIPLINGVSAAAQGGDIMDIAIAVGASYAGAQLGSVAGKYVGSQISNATISAIAEEAVSGATKSMVMAAATGGDIGRAALTGAASGAISGGIDEVGAYLSDTYGTIDTIKLDDGFTWDDASFTETYESVGLELSDIIDGYESLPEIVKDIISGTATSAIETYVTTGNAPSEEHLASIMTNAAITGNAAAGFFENNLGMDAKVAAQTTKIIGDVVNSAFTGADPYDAYRASLTSTFQQDLNEEINNITGGGIAQALDQITGSAGEYQNAVTTLNNSTTAVNDAGTLVNDKVAEAQALLDGKTDIPGLPAGYGRTEWEADAGENSEEARARQAKWNAAYEIKQDELDDLQASYQGLLAVYEGNRVDFTAAQENVFTAQQYLDEASEPTVRVAQTAVVKALVPEFNPDEYREIHGAYISNPYQHWLDNRRTLAVSRDDYNQRINNSIGQHSEFNKFIMSNIDKPGEPRGGIKTNGQLRDLYNRVYEALDANGLYSPEGALSPQGAEIAYMAAEEYMREGMERLPLLQNIPLEEREEELPPVEYKYEADVTPTDIFKEDAIFVIEDLNKILSSSDLDADGRIKFVATKRPKIGLPIFYEPLNKKVIPIYDVPSGTALYVDAETNQPIAAYSGGIIDKEGRIHWPNEDVGFYKSLGIDVPPADSGAETWEEYNEGLRSNVDFWRYPPSGILDSEYTANILEKLPDGEEKQAYIEAYYGAVQRVADEGGFTLLTKGQTREGPIKSIRLYDEWTRVENLPSYSSGVVNTPIYVDPATGQRVTKERFAEVYNSLAYGPPDSDFIEYGLESELSPIDFIAAEKTVIRPAISVQEIAGMVPLAVMDAAQNIDVGSAGYDSLSWFGRRLVDATDLVQEYDDWIDRSIAKEEKRQQEMTEEEREALPIGIQIDNLKKQSEANKLNTGQIVGAVAELGSAFHSLATYTKDELGLYTDVRDTEVGQLFNTLMLTAQAIQPEEYNTVAKELFTELGEVEGFLPTLGHVWDVISGDDPLKREILFREYVIKEVIQEIPLALGSGLAGSIVKHGGFALAKRGASREVADAAAREAAEEFVKKFAGKTAIGANAVLQMAETAGANAGETFAVTFDALVEVGYNEREANEIAAEAAMTNGAVTALLELGLGQLALGGGPTGKVVQRWIRGMPPNMQKYAITTNILGEGISEAIEENAGLAHRAHVIEYYAPEASVLQPGGEYHDMGNAHALATAFGFVSGTGTSATMMTGLYPTLSGEDKLPPRDNAPPAPPTSYNTGSVSGNILLNLNPNIHSTVDDAVNSEDPEVKTQAENDIKAFFGYDRPPDDGDGGDGGGVFRFNTTVDILNTINPDAYHTYNDVSTAFSNNEAQSQIGFVPTKQDIQTFVGGRPPDDGDDGGGGGLQANVDGYIDANFTTPSEVSVHFNELDYSPTEEEVGQFTGRGPQTERIDSIAPYIDPRQTTTDEVLDYFSGLGYEATFDEAALFTGQGGADFEAAQLPTIDPYVDPRQLTRSEAEEYFEGQGYTPTEDEITRFIGQKDEAQQLADIGSYIDPRQVTRSEAEAYFEAQGYTPTKEEVDRYIAQGGADFQATQFTDIGSYIDPRQVTRSEAEAYFEGQGYTPTKEEVDRYIAQGGTDFQATQFADISSYVDPRQTTTDEILKYFESLGYTPEQAETALFTGQGGTDFEATQLPTIDPYVDPRQVTRSEAEAYFRAQGYTPTEDEITRFITQANDPTFQATQEQKLTEEFDPLAVLPEEARQAYEAAGFFDALDPDVERLAGQYPESELGSRVQDALPVATYNSIANMLGKPGQEVTQTDVNFVADIIAQNEVVQELADTAPPAPLSQEQLMYDVTGDNIIDIADQTMLEQIIAGTVPQTDIASESAFAATGVQGQLQQQMQMQQQVQTQIQTQIQEDERRRAAQREQQYMQSLLETSPVKVETPEAKPIEYMYDPFGESIFATPKQGQMFGAATPYAAKGGLVKNTTDEILEIMRGG